MVSHAAKIALAYFWPFDLLSELYWLLVTLRQDLLFITLINLRESKEHHSRYCHGQYSHS